MHDRPQGVMLFAAGLGLRMRPLTDDRPKCMVPVENRPLIDHALEVVEDAGAYPIAVNAHHFAALLAKHLSDCDVSISYEAPAPLETGGGLKRAVQDGFLPADQPVFTLNTDAVWRGENPLTQLAAAWRPEMDALVLLTGDSDVKDFSLDDSGRIRRGADYRYTGAQIIRPSFVMSHHETVFSLNAVWDGLISQGTAFGLVHQGDCCDVGEPAAIQKAEAMLVGAK